MIKLQEYKNVKRVKLKDCCSAIFSGGTPLTSKEQYYDGNIPWIRSGEIDFNRIFRSERNISQEGLENSSAKLIRPKSVVMAMTGATVAKVATIEAEMAANQSVCAIETNSLLDYRFLYFYLATKYLQLRNSAQGALTSLNLERIKNIEIPLPPLNIQKEIVTILDSFTSLIDKMKQEVEMRKKQMDYYREKLFSFGKGECEWRSLNELFTFKNGINKGKSDFGRGTPIINYVDVYRKRGLVKEDIKGLVKSNASEQSRYKCKRGDVFFTRTSETKEEVGFPSVLLEDIENCVFSGFVLKATPTTDLLDTHYCKYCFFTYQFRKEVIKSATYTTRALTNGTSLSKISIPVPSLEKQRQIASILDSFETYISKLEQMIELRQKQYEYYREKLLTFE